VVVAINAASAALCVSNIPWDGPAGCVRIGRFGVRRGFRNVDEGTGGFVTSLGRQDRRRAPSRHGRRIFRSLSGECGEGGEGCSKARSDEEASTCSQWPPVLRWHSRAGVLREGSAGRRQQSSALAVIAEWRGLKTHLCRSRRGRSLCSSSTVQDTT